MFRYMSAPLKNTAYALQLHHRGELMTPLAQGALWWAARRTLIVSDLHFEKGSSFARRGQLLPPYDTSMTLKVVETLVDEFAPDCVVSLGDSFHDPAAEARLSPAERLRIRALTARTDWVWVEGNHDPDPPAHLGGRGAKTFRMGDCVFRHEPTGEIGEISGHLHPVARVTGRGRVVRRKCFISDGHRLIMPSMGAYTGGLNILDDAVTRHFADGWIAFAAGEKQVHMVDRKLLALDHTAGRKDQLWRL